MYVLLSVTFVFLVKKTLEMGYHVIRRQDFFSGSRLYIHNFVYVILNETERTKFTFFHLRTRFLVDLFLDIMIKCGSVCKDLKN